MLDHLSIQCADIAASAAFYDAVLAPLGGARIMDFGNVIGYGMDGKPDFWIGEQTTGGANRESHIAFFATDRATVHAFFDAAVASGAEVLHEPRVWPEYHPNYYGAFVRDPDGNNVEAVCHSRSDARRRPARDRTSTCCMPSRWRRRRVPAAAVGGACAAATAVVLVAEIDGELVGRITVDTTYADADISGFVVAEASPPAGNRHAR